MTSTVRVILVAEPDVEELATTVEEKGAESSRSTMSMVWLVRIPFLFMGEFHVAMAMMLKRLLVELYTESEEFSDSSGF